LLLLFMCLATLKHTQPLTTNMSNNLPTFEKSGQDSG
jgi:hypothetical protein